MSYVRAEPPYGDYRQPRDRLLHSPGGRVTDRQYAEALDLFDVVPSLTLRCLVLQCTGCGWTRHLNPGGSGGKPLAHIVDLARDHARDVDHGQAQVCGAQYGSSVFTCQKPPHTPDGSHRATARGHVLTW